MTIVIAAAGTGGHVYPGLAVAEALVDQGVERRDIVFFGGDRFEAKAVPEAGFGFAGFELTKLRRAVSADNLRIPFVLRRTAAEMADHLAEIEARVILGMSGYVTVPAAIAAKKSGVPFFVHEQNASPGLAARYAARRARSTFLGLPGRAERLPRSVLVGNPLRRQIALFDRHELRPRAISRYGLAGEGPFLGILGGSQGARVLNLQAGAIAGLDSVDAVVHLTGGQHFPSEGRSSRWVTRDFEPQMEFFYAAADLVVCRAGAMTVSELAATSTPAILVPLDRVGQQWNARALGDAGAAAVVAQKDVEVLPKRIGELLANRRALDAMGHAAGALGRPQAAADVALALLEARDG